MHPDFLDRFSRRQSPIHALAARWKIAIALGLILAIVATPLAWWPALGVLGAIVLGGYALARLPWRYLARRLAIVLPFLLLVALGAPLSHGGGAGWLLAAGVVVRGLLSITVMLTLVATTPFAALLAALERLGLPRMLIWILTFMYRYLFVFADELERMQRAQAARTFGPRSRRDFQTLSNFVGVLFVRAFERAERVYAAMCARGWNYQTPVFDASGPTRAPAPPPDKHAHGHHHAATVAVDGSAGHAHADHHAHAEHAELVAPLAALAAPADDGRGAPTPR